MRDLRVARRKFDLMELEQLAGCGSVTTYARKDFEQDSFSYLILRHYQTF
jgi:hypothetical protein